MNLRNLIYFVLIVIATSCQEQSENTEPVSGEPHRPLMHFTPETGWMNDPNGLLYYGDTYHMFYQHYPDSTVWGPMHWGHATSKDLVKWTHQPIALYPDSLGYIFSGSAVADKNNTSGFGKDGVTPLVAIFTHHLMEGEKSGRSDYQNQSLAYSLDEGKTWTKYAGNPVLKSPGIKDFRDPKVFWYEAGSKWIMSLATVDRISFYSSPDLKSWKLESDFGKEAGAHGGVWECPDLFPLQLNGKQVWVLLVSINPGGPNGGSATQYFTGDFDGSKFTSTQAKTKWLDFGPDNYAGVTWSNTGDRKIFLGWMSNWQYGNLVPTIKWRSAMTIPRDLKAVEVNGDTYVTSVPVPELDAANAAPVIIENVLAGDDKLTDRLSKLSGPGKLTVTLDKKDSLAIILSNGRGQELVVGYDSRSDQYFIDRTKAGKSDFEAGFAKRHVSPRISTTDALNMTVIIDNASIELFADNGLSVMTAIFFPDDNYNTIRLRANEKLPLKMVQFNAYNR